MEPFLYFPVKNPINQSNLFGANPAQYKPLGQNGHPGNDFEAPSYTPIYAPCDGGARYVKDSLGGDGLWIYYVDGKGNFCNVILWHMPVAADKEHWVLPTDGTMTPIKAGQLIGYTDNSGFPQESTGPHLHLGVMPCDVHGNDLAPTNGFLGCVDPQPFYIGKYAEDIATEQQVIEKSAAVISLVAQATDQQIPHQEKLDILEEIEEFIRKYL